MPRSDYLQYNFRLNLNNPDHLRVYRTLTDLNRDIHKSKSSFIVTALLRYIDGASMDELTNEGAKQKKDIITREEYEQLVSRVTALENVLEFMSRAALTNTGLGNPYMQMIQFAMQNTMKQENLQTVTPGEQEEAEKALEEMAMLFSQEHYGEE